MSNSNEKILQTAKKAVADDLSGMDYPCTGFEITRAEIDIEQTNKEIIYVVVTADIQWSVGEDEEYEEKKGVDYGVKIQAELNPDLTLRDINYLY